MVSFSRGGLLSLGLLFTFAIGGRIFGTPASQEKEPRPQEPKLRIEIDVPGKAPADNRPDKGGQLKGQWLGLKTRHFEVFGDAAESDLKQAASELELFRDQFARLFPRARNGSSVPTRVIVFRDEKVRDALRPAGGSSLSGAYLRTGQNTDYIVLTGGEGLSRGLLQSYVRTMMRDIASPVPLWFQVGVAEYFGTYRLTRLGENRLVKIGLDEYKALNEKDVAPFSTLSAVDETSFEAMDSRNRSAFTAQSCAVFYYLLQTRHLSMMLRFFNALADGEPADQTFETIFAMPLPVFDERVQHQAHILNNEGWYTNYAAFSVNPETRLLALLLVNDPKVPHMVTTIRANTDIVRQEVEALQPTLLSEAETQVQIGDLLIHNGRVLEAQPFLERAVELDPELSGAYLSLATTHALRRSYGPAREFIEKALALHPEDHLANYYSGRILRMELETTGVYPEVTLETMRAALKKSVESNPAFVPSAELLAETLHLMRGDAGLQSRLLMGALKRSPGRLSVLSALARVAADANDDSSAAWILRRVIASGTASPEVKREARSLLGQLDPAARGHSALGNLDEDEGSDLPGMSVFLPTKQQRKDKERKKGEEQIVRGEITQLECSKGLTIYIRVGIKDLDHRIENLQTDTPSSVRWISDSGEALDAVPCGKMLARTAISYRPNRKGLMMGEPLLVELCRVGSTDCAVIQPPERPVD